MSGDEDHASVNGERGSSSENVGAAGSSGAGEARAGNGAPEPTEAPLPVEPVEAPVPVQPLEAPLPVEPSPDPAAVVDEGASDPVAAALERISDGLTAMSRRIDELARLGDRREEMIDRLHAENQKLRAGEIAQVQAPVLRELIRSYDLVVTLARQDSPAVKDLDLVRRRLLDGLDQAGVRPLEPERGAQFDADLHSATQRVSTDDPGLDMTVAQTVRVGFVQDGQRVLRPADVAVHRFLAPVAPAGDEPADGLATTTHGEE